MNQISAINEFISIKSKAVFLTANEFKRPNDQQDRRSQCSRKQYFQANTSKVLVQ